MKTTAVGRIVAALISVTVTLSMVNAIALYGYPNPANTEAQIGRHITTVVASLSQMEVTQ